MMFKTQTYTLLSQEFPVKVPDITVNELGFEPLSSRFFFETRLVRAPNDPYVFEFMELVAEPQQSVD